MTSKKTHLCIHGHFYQPPRENPWIEEIEAQENVGGIYHDWNERISSECYHPNAFARVLDGEQQIENIVNNYESLSFNFGPTLLSWMEKYDPRTYERIIEADRKSIKERGGHGNALAQVYNHIIMPLANRRDKITQVKWGIADFKKRFGRTPESMWLAETACNEESLQVLIEEGMKFLILAPHQAEKIKRFSDAHWSDVSGGNVDPTHPYRCFLNDSSGRYIDIFFYDGPVSKSVAFDDLVNDARIFAHRLENARRPDRRHTELIHVATDGETYGHHKIFGDRALAYLLKTEAAKHGFVITNYGEFLEKFPPEYEVKIKSGENGLGTSWSCAHGVKRWSDHCGCRGDGPGHWRQDWRRPLRETFDWLRDELALIFTKEGNKYFHDAWEARNDYINVVLDRSHKSREDFFRKHAKYILSKDDVVICYKLLEMQRSAMLMYTSCGWFFTEVSGEETVQVIKYAARAVQLAESVIKADLTTEFSSRLRKIKSNMEYFGDGEGVYEHLVKPSIATLERVVSHFAISSLFKNYNDQFTIYGYEFENLDYRKENLGDLTLCLGRVKVRSIVTFEEIDVVYVLLQSEIYDFYCYVRPFSEISDYLKFGHELFGEFLLGHRNSMGKIIYERFGTEYFSLKDLFKEERKEILALLSRDAIERFKHLADELLQKHRRMIDVYRMTKIPLPDECRFVVEQKLSGDFNDLINKSILSDSEVFDRAHAIRVLAKELGLKLNRSHAEQFLTKQLNETIAGLRIKWNDGKIKDCLSMVKVAQRLGIEVDFRMSQEHYLAIAERLEHDKTYAATAGGQSIFDFIDLGRRLGINVEAIKLNRESPLFKAAFFPSQPGN
ncbi:MAG: DUF3536 domain-containing protein [Candidatus Omnitrophota bacterium]